jgi:hypothetical protein
MHIYIFVERMHSTTLCILKCTNAHVSALKDESYGEDEYEDEDDDESDG